ncbi:hypothetical protein [Streptomyces sp. MT206]|uniref:hypothetical protein n=1 Tax=Streptomyces sp. MT206 TaxID=3031407 RepID=UPI002FCB3BE2
MTAAVTGCPDPDPRVRLTRLADRAELLVDVEEKTEEVAHRLEGVLYPGPGPEVVAAREAARGLTRLAALHADDELTDPDALAELEESLTTAATVVQAIETMSEPADARAAGDARADAASGPGVLPT